MGIDEVGIDKVGIDKVGINQQQIRQNLSVTLAVQDIQTLSFDLPIKVKKELEAITVKKIEMFSGDVCFH